MIDSPILEADEKTEQGSINPLALVGSVWPKKKKESNHAMILPLPVTRGAPN